jgi:hypothetical protein
MATNTPAQRPPFRSYLAEHRDEIIDWINNNIKTYFNPSGEIFDRLANQVREEYPYGQGIDNMHRYMTNAIMCSLWCGWFSQARSNAHDPNFTTEFIDDFRKLLKDSFELGRAFAPQKP